MVFPADNLLAIPANEVSPKCRIYLLFLHTWFLTMKIPNQCGTSSHFRCSCSRGYRFDQSIHIRTGLAGPDDEVHLKHKQTRDENWMEKMPTRKTMRTSNMTIVMCCYHNRSMRYDAMNLVSSLSRAPDLRNSDAFAASFSDSLSFSHKKSDHVTGQTCENVYINLLSIQWGNPQVFFTVVDTEKQSI